MCVVLVFFLECITKMFNDKKGSMQIGNKLIDILIGVFFAVALVPTIIYQILNANLTGIYKTIWSILAIAVVGGVLYMILQSVKAGHKGI